MPRKKQCSFCGERFEPGKGTTFVRNDASVFEFCSSKCRKNYNLGRNPIRVRWTQKFRAFREETLGIRAKKDEPKAEKTAAKSEEAAKPKKDAGKTAKTKSGRKIRAEKRLERKAKRAAKQGRAPAKKAAGPKAGKAAKSAKEAKR